MAPALFVREPPNAGRMAATTARIDCRPEVLWFSAKPFMYSPAEVDDAPVIEVAST